MKKTILLAALVAALVPSSRAQNATTAAPASSNPLADLTVTGAFDYESQYVFRGKKVTNSAFQPSVDLSYLVYGGSLHGYIWTNQPISTRGNGVGPNQSNEIDIGTYYVHSLADWGVPNTSVDVGYQYYWYPEAQGNSGPTFTTGGQFAGWTYGRSSEAHIGFQYDTSSVLNGYNINPQIYYFHDFNLDSNTIQFSLSYTYDLSDATSVKGLALVPSAQVGWTGIHRGFGDQLGPLGVGNWKNSYVYWLLSAEVQYKLNSWATAFAGVRYSGNSDGTTNGFAATNPQLGGTQNSIWGGLGIRFGM